MTEPLRLRSLLFAPANRPELAPKLARSGADGVVLDLEDAVPAGEKDAAREVIDHSVAEIHAAEAPRTLVFVRVNAVPTPWFGDDLATAARAGADGIVVPKVESIEHLAVLARELTDVGRPALPIVAGIESALGVECARDLVAGGVAAAYFGAEDYIADLGGVRTGGSDEVAYARSRVVLAARLAGIGALDQVVVAYQDDERFRADAAVGRALGYRGKLCIHPRQVAFANEVFGVSADEVERARRIVETYEQAASTGAGVVSVDGQMVDEPMVRLARAVLAEAE